MEISSKSHHHNFCHMDSHTAMTMATTPCMIRTMAKPPSMPHVHSHIQHPLGPPPSLQPQQTTKPCDQTDRQQQPSPARPQETPSLTYSTSTPASCALPLTSWQAPPSLTKSMYFFGFFTNYHPKPIACTPAPTYTI